MEEGEQGYVFTHDLIREVVVADLSAARRAYYYLQIAAALARGPQEPPVEQLAYHYARAGTQDQAILYLEKAGDKAQKARAQAEAATYFRDVVTRLDALGHAVEAARVREKLGATCMTTTQYPEALGAFERAVEAYSAATDWEGAGRALAQIGWVHALRGTPSEGIARLRRELQDADRFPAQALAAQFVALAQLYVVSGRYGEQLEAATRAAEQAQRAADQRLLAQAEQRRGTALLMLGRLAEGSHVLSLVRSGEAWRLLPHDLPPWQTVYHYFRLWRQDGTWERIHTRLQEEARRRMGREPTPSGAISDSQSVKTTEKGGPRTTTATMRARS